MRARTTAICLSLRVKMELMRVFQRQTFCSAWRLASVSSKCTYSLLQFQSYISMTLTISVCYHKRSRTTLPTSDRCRIEDEKVVALACKISNPSDDSRQLTKRETFGPHDKRYSSLIRQCFDAAYEQRASERAIDYKTHLIVCFASLRVHLNSRSFSPLICVCYCSPAYWLSSSP